MKYTAVIERARDHVDRLIAQWAIARPDLGVAAKEVTARLGRCTRHLERGADRVLAEFGLSGCEFHVLAALRRSGPPFRASPTELARTLMLTSGSITNRVDRLERAGLVARARDPDDRRGVLVELSAKGQTMIDAAIDAHVAQEERMLGALTAGERRQLTLLLRKLLLSFENEAGSRTEAPDASAREALPV